MLCFGVFNFPPNSATLGDNRPCAAWIQQSNILMARYTYLHWWQLCWIVRIATCATYGYLYLFFKPVDSLMHSVLLLQSNNSYHLKRFLCGHYDATWPTFLLFTNKNLLQSLLLKLRPSTFDFANALRITMALTVSKLLTLSSTS